MPNDYKSQAKPVDTHPEQELQEDISDLQKLSSELKFEMSCLRWKIRNRISSANNFAGDNFSEDLGDKENIESGLSFTN